MADFTVSFRTIPDTRRAVGRAGTHTDRRSTGPRAAPAAWASASTAANCSRSPSADASATTCNTPRRKRGIAIRHLAVDVSVTITGEPLIAESADVRIAVTAEDPAADIDRLIEAATAITAVGNSVARGFPVRFRRQGDD